jgi:hypothetical protein
MPSEEAQEGQAQVEVSEELSLDELDAAAGGAKKTGYINNA